jgi:hypothetical protein
MKTAIFAALIALALPVVALADSGRTPSPRGAKVFIIEPKDGATVSGPLTIKFGIEGMDVAPAGTDKPNTGHHHLLIDATLVDFSDAIPKDEAHIHYGKGQTETSITLKPGPHTLQLLLGDKNHIPHDPPVMSEVVAITVK